MKKINNNNKFRGNAVYSLNYKFDSVSPAGKCSGTALDLIKRYNELAKEAQNNGDYVGMEVFRQYAEHYRKIVTEINERKYQSRENQNGNNTENSAAENSQSTDTTEPVNNGLVETQSVEPAPVTSAEPTEAAAPTHKARRTRTFTVIDASNSSEVPTETENKPQRRTYTRRTKATAKTADE